MGGTGVWLKYSVGIIVGLVAIGTAIVGVITWQYTTFATDEEVKLGDKDACEKVVQLSEETLKGFESVNETNMQMQKSIRRFDLKDSYKRLLTEKHDILEKIKESPNSTELKIDLDVCRGRIKMIEEELKALRISK